MIQTIKNIAHLLVLSAIVMITVHTAAVLTTFCTSNVVCLGSVYFGVPSYQATIPMVAMESGLSTPTVVVTEGVSFADVHLVVEAVGLYALLLGVFLLILLQILELRNLRKIFNQKPVRR
jgi:hypothetical protein